MQTLLNAHELRKSFGGNHAVAGVSFSIAPQKITAIIGPNGSGKSTLFNLLTCALAKDSGYFTIADKRIKNATDHHLARTMLSRTFQETNAFTYLTVREHMQLALSVHDQSFFSSFLFPSRESDAKLKKTLQLLGLEEQLDKQGSELSYGQTKLLMIAMALAKKHDILLLDEPVAGVNPAYRKKIGVILKELAQAGETILLIEHDMNFVLSIADWMIVMDLGKVILKGTPADVISNKEVLKAYLGG